MTQAIDSVETIRPYLRTMKKGLSANMTEPFDLVTLLKKAKEETSACEESSDTETQERQSEH